MCRFLTLLMLCVLLGAGCKKTVTTKSADGCRSRYTVVKDAHGRYQKDGRLTKFDYWGKRQSISTWVKGVQEGPTTEFVGNDKTITQYLHGVKLNSMTFDKKYKTSECAALCGGGRQSAKSKGAKVLWTIFNAKGQIKKTTFYRGDWKYKEETYAWIPAELVKPPYTECAIIKTLNYGGTRGTDVDTTIRSIRRQGGSEWEDVR